MKRSIWKYAIIGSLLTGCKTYNPPSVSPFKGGESRSETRATQDSTYHYVKDSVVVYIGKLEDLEDLGGLGKLGEPGGIERWHTEWRDRIVTKTDTVYQDREVVVQLPPERYVPRVVRWLAWAGGAAILGICLWMIRKIRGL